MSDLRHIDYPHEPGYLYDCLKCEAECHCAPGSAQCVHCNMLDEPEEWTKMEEQDTDAGETIVLDEELRDETL